MIVAIAFFVKFSTNNEEQNITMPTNNKEIKSEQDAIEIAKSYVFKRYNQNFDDYRIKTKLDNDIWIVYYVDDSEVDGGGGSEVKIKKSMVKLLVAFYNSREELKVGHIWRQVGSKDYLVGQTYSFRLTAGQSRKYK